MIGRIRGSLLEKQLTEILVDVNGIAYEISVPMSTFYKLPDIGQGVVLHTHLAVREDAQVLYGFMEMAEKNLFRTLIKVSGVGPKLALAILSGMAVDDFVRTVNANDVASLVRMPGVGKKTAERLIIEMRDKLTDWVPADVPAGRDQPGVPGGEYSIAAEAETALVSLGYKPAEASRTVSKVLKENSDISDSESLIRLALKGMG
ncbi:MAG: Holliday junction branch migration protein RuvA [Gammaproteobacteria bacterium]|nr:Holliday junction branch migration protein RuvA [Gammaproteobacteria bacterium]